MGETEFRKRVIVIGEDDDAIATLLRDALNDESAYQAVVVADGALVLETVRKVRADLIILDIMMPGLSGIEVFDRVRADAEIKHVPVLFISAVRDQYDAQLRERGVEHIITKPFGLNDILERVRTICPP